MAGSNEWFTKYIETLDKRLEGLESKMESMLKFKWQIMGGTAVASAIVGVLIQIIIAMWSK